MRQSLKRILLPIRRLAARFADADTVLANNSIIFKAANIVAADKIEGDYLEFGVYAGNSFIRAYQVIQQVFEQHQRLHAGRTAQDAQAIKRLWEKMRFFAFDSFQGLPEIENIDKQGNDFAKGKYEYPETKFQNNLREAGVPLRQVVTVAGWFQDTCTAATLQKHRLTKAAIIHIDSDLYSSAKTVLNFVTPLLTDGTIIIFDDWYCFRGNPNLGEQKAFHEWRATLTGWTLSEYQKEGPWRNSFIASKL